ncbi:hypothetical cytosolic protein [Syntrophus aciditrophicus SB]|uniref:Hypothetical cytosolic protein n=1 Tax=Syntrophus aciditrophicus (strain SB) TaxID=56780 RepID=Q2LTT6_SYNAS|nr:hypothetical cytosolic protein [Syntrophus aciditrophicus SB]
MISLHFQYETLYCLVFRKKFFTNSLQSFSGKLNWTSTNLREELCKKEQFDFSM